jgi:hypothetical protein
MLGRRNTILYPLLYRERSWGIKSPSKDEKNPEPLKARMALLHAGKPRCIDSGISFT